MGFDAGAALEPLDYNFEKFDAGSGTIPEPTRAQIRDFEKWRLSTFGDAATVADLAERYQAMSDDEAAESDREAVVAIARLCSDSPNAEQLEKLPARVFRAFWAWLWTQLTDPTLSGSATTLSPAAASNGSAGR